MKNGARASSTPSWRVWSGLPSGSRSLWGVDPEHPSTPQAVERVPDVSILTKVEGELADVERALGRLDDGTYGTCQVCGAAIADERLAAEPATPLCREHATS